jgi:hypothetical protein
MQFRWIAGIALWTMLSGPVFNGQGSLSTIATPKGSPARSHVASTPDTHGKPATPARAIGAPERAPVR